MMLVGEGSVFVIILFGGAFIIERAYKKENDLNRMQENFLLSVSHELKTPISSITLFLQTLQKRDLDESKREEIYSRSLGEIRRLESLVSNLLISRSIEDKNYFLNKTPLALDAFVKNLVATLSSSTLQYHVIETDLQAVELEVDPEALSSILTNLLQNAAKYSPPQSNISIGLTEANDEVSIEIADQGIGITDQEKNFVFNRFYRVENEMTRISKGTGLGLFITRFLVEQHGGQINLRDNTPQGLIVTIQFSKQKK